MDDFPEPAGKPYEENEGTDNGVHHVCYSGQLVMATMLLVAGMVFVHSRYHCVQMFCFSQTSEETNQLDVDVV